MRRTALILSNIALVLALSSPVVAATGDLDSSFGSDGRATTNFTDGDDVGIAVAVQPDQKIVVGGSADSGGGHRKFGLARYNADGSLDTTFSVDGKVATRFSSGISWINAVAVQADGKIVAVGGAFVAPTSDYNVKLALARYNVDGSLDTSFGGDGTVTTNVGPGYDYLEDVALQGDGKIVVAGAVNLLKGGAKFIVARYDTDGSLDATFGGDGMALKDVSTGFEGALAVAIQADGSIVAAGASTPSGSNDDRFVLLRYTTGGDLDPTFSGDGKVITNFTDGSDFLWDVAIQNDQKIVAVGRANGKGGRFALARYDTDGSLDSAFGIDGKVMTNLDSGDDEATGVAIQADGAIVVAGWSGPADSNNSRFAIVRYSVNGSLDTTFSVDGKVETNFTSGSDLAWDVALQADGRIVAVGRAGEKGGRFAVARYLVS